MDIINGKAIRTEIDSTIETLTHKYLGKAALSLDGVRYEGLVYGGNGVFRFVSNITTGMPFSVCFSLADLLPDPGIYPWRVALKPRPGIWEKAILTDLSRGAGKET